MSGLPAEPKVEYVDRPELTETFADSVAAMVFDGQMLRIELCTTRLELVQPSTPPKASRRPVSRLVLPPNAAVELYNRLQQTMAALLQQGVLKQASPGTPQPEHLEKAAS